MTLSKTPTVVNTIPFALDGGGSIYALTLTAAAAAADVLTRRMVKALAGTGTASATSGRTARRSMLVNAGGTATTLRAITRSLLGSPSAGGSSVRSLSRTLPVPATAVANWAVALARTLACLVTALGAAPARLISWAFLVDAGAVPDVALGIDRMLTAPTGTVPAVGVTARMIRTLTAAVDAGGSLLRLTVRRLSTIGVATGELRRWTSQRMTAPAQTDGATSLLQRLSLTLTTSTGTDPSLTASRVRVLTLAATMAAGAALSTGGARSLVLLAELPATVALARSLATGLTGSVFGGGRLRRNSTTTVRSSTGASGSSASALDRVLSATADVASSAGLFILRPLAAVVDAVIGVGRRLALSRITDTDAGADLSRQTRRNVAVLADAVAVAGTLRGLARTITTTVTPSAGLTTAVRRRLTAAGDGDGSLTRTVSLPVRVTIEVAAGALRVAARTLPSSVAAFPAAALDRTLTVLALSASAVANGAATRTAARVLSGAAGASGSYVRRMCLVVVTAVDTAGDLAIRYLPRSLALVAGIARLPWTAAVRAARWSASGPVSRWRSGPPRHR